MDGEVGGGRCEVGVACINSAESHPAGWEDVSVGDWMAGWLGGWMAGWALAWPMVDDWQSVTIDAATTDAAEIAS